MGKAKKKEKKGKRQEERKQKKKKKKKPRKERMMEVKKIAEEWKIWNKEKEVARSEKKAKKMVPEHFHK